MNLQSSNMFTGQRIWKRLAYVPSQYENGNREHRGVRAVWKQQEENAVVEAAGLHLELLRGGACPSRGSRRARHPPRRPRDWRCSRLGVARDTLSWSNLHHRALGIFLYFPLLHALTLKMGHGNSNKLYVTHAEHSGMFGQHTASSAGHKA